MKRLFGSIRLKVVVLAVLIGLTFQFALVAKETKGCERCVYPTGGICSGCIDSTFGGNWCWPIQENCSCTMGGGCGPLGGLTVCDWGN